MDSNGTDTGYQTGVASDFTHPMGPTFGKTLGDMRFMGWVGLIYGIITCLSVVGAVVGVPMIIACHRFIEGVNRFENYRRDSSSEELKAGFAEIGRGFRYMKVLIIIYIVLTLGSLAFVFMLGGLSLLSELAANAS